MAQGYLKWVNKINSNGNFLEIFKYRLNKICDVFNYIVPSMFLALKEIKVVLEKKV